jgi:hypothetical protein
MLAPEKLSSKPIFVGVESQETEGDVFLARAAYSKVPWMEAIVGCPIRVGLASRSIWAEPALPEGWADNPLRLKIDAEWREKLLDFVRYLVRNSQGRYLVTPTLMRGPSDMAAALLGKETFCLALVEHQQPLCDLLDFCTDIFIETAKAQLELIPSFHGGYCSSYGVWAPGMCVRTQDDVSALFSAEHCRRFVLPSQERIAASFDYSLVHLHSGSLHTADLYAAGNIKALQVSLDPPLGAERTKRLLPILLRMMEKKPLIVTGELIQAELDYLLSGLPAAGLCLAVEVLD